MKLSRLACFACVMVCPLIGGPAAVDAQPGTTAPSPLGSADTGMEGRLAADPMGAGMPIPHLVVFKLVNTDAVAVRDTLRQLFPEVNMVVSEQTNSLFVRGGTRDQMLQLEAVIKVLDQAEGKKPGKTTSPAPMGSTGADVPLLEKRLRDAEREATGLASQRGGTINPMVQQDLRQRVRREVESAFEARQQLQRARLQQLRERLEHIEKSIAARERLKDRIIDHRVDELLNPNLRWDPNAPTMGMPGGVSTNPTGMPGMDPYNTGGSPFGEP